MQAFIGREAEIQVFSEALASSGAELVAVFGRRRVGKTFLIRHVYGKQTVFEFSGIKGTSAARQLERFGLALAKSFGLEMPPAKLRSWLHAFSLLSDLLEKPASSPKKKRVVFLDEFPWMDSPRSGFLAAFDHFWNSWATKQPNLVVVICGSAASWMIQNVVRNKGGLHNRLTRRIRLAPFNLNETEQFLQSQRIQLKRYQILQLYMMTGGIPHYLKELRRGESIEQTIDRLFFAQDGLLRDEFDNLYPALFDQPERHLAVVRALAEKPSGMTRNQLIKVCPFDSGGSTTKMLEELLESGFVQQYLPFGKATKDAVFKLSDEYTVFYLKFIENSKASGEGSWMNKSQSQGYRTWCGFAFENICLRHVAQIKKGLGISGIYTEQSLWRSDGRDGEPGAQIDLLLDRADNSINLIEIKFAASEFVIDKKYASELEAKKRVFADRTATRKNLFLTMLTCYGVKKNEYFYNTIQRELTMDALFEAGR
ncbi:MAG: AAA family ATPase [Saprospiraceae bacterium]